MNGRSRVRLVAVAAVALVPAIAAPIAHAADLTIDDRGLTASKRGWASVTAKSANAGTLSRSKKKGATLTAGPASTTGGTLIVQVGKGRGTLSLMVGKGKKKSIPTSAKKTALKSVTFSGSGAVTLSVTKQGSGVYVDALVLTGAGGSGGTPAPGPSTGSPTPTPSAGPKTTPSTPSPINTGPITQLDATAAGAGGNGNNVTDVAVSPNGLLVAFWSDATNLVNGVNNGFPHLYVKSINTGTITVQDRDASGNLSNDTTSSTGARGIAWSPDSKELLFTSSGTNIDPSNTTGHSGPYLFDKDITDGSVVAVAADHVSIDMAWSPDMKWIVFGSQSDYCQPAQAGCVQTASSDTKLYARLASGGPVIPVSSDSSGKQPIPNAGPNGSTHPVFSPDSTKVAFESDSPQLVTGDTNIASDVFVKDLGTRTTTRVSVNGSGGQANGASEWPAWSPDGTKIAFDSKADNLVLGDGNASYDVFSKDLASGAVTALSTTPAGEFKVFDSRVPKWSPDGTKVSFNTKTVDLIPGFVDTNNVEDIYVRTLATGVSQLVSAKADGGLGTNDSTQWGVWGSGGGWLPDSHSLVFLSRSPNFSAADNNAFNPSVFIKGGL